MIDKLVRKDIKNFIPYNANQIQYNVKLDANESPFDLPKNVRTKLAEFICNDPGLNIYPDTNSINLRNILADFWDVTIDNIVVGTGSDQLIQVLMNTFVEEGERVLCPVPSFSMYKLSCIIAGGIPVEFELNPQNDYKYETDIIINMARKHSPKIVFLCTPNNPTGNSIPYKDIKQIAESCNNSIVVIDEAYGEFSGETALDLVKQHENVIILRTFSKAYGLAGMRCGYSISSVAVANEMNKVKPPYNISSLSQKAAELILQENQIITEQINYLNQQRDLLYKRLSEFHQIHVYTSNSNFILARLENCSSICTQLATKGILVRGFGNEILLKDCMRISIGTSEQNNLLIEELKKILDNTKV